MQLDKRTREDIIQEMEELAASYTPEWKFRTRQGDSGSALFHIYSDMLVEMLRRYNRVPEQDRQAFFRMLGARQKPAEPAQGYVSFGLVHPEAEGIGLPAGTGLWGAGEDGEPVKLETQKEVFITNNRMGPVLYQNGEQDRIYCLAEGEGTLSHTLSENLQKHVCWLGHSVVFHTGEEAELLIAFQSQRGSQDWDALIQDQEKTGFSYLSEQGEYPFEAWSCHNHIIRLKKTREMPGLGDWEGEPSSFCGIQWQAKDIRAYAGLEMTELLVGSVSPSIPPDYVYTAEGQEGCQRFFPFGERPYSYGTCSICSNEVFGKKGARIHLTLTIEFRKVPLLSEAVPLPVHWKTIMKQSDFPRLEEQPVTIDEVVWEYYNGTGFTRLFPESGYTDIFSPLQEDAEQPGVRSERLSFFCPEDIAPVLVNARTVYCIRIRILRMQHEYAVNGYYLSPFVTQIEAAYDYEASMQEPELCRCLNNLEEHPYKKNRTWIPFLPQPDPHSGIYIGFSEPLSGGPYGIYLELAGRSGNQLKKQWNYEYYNGREWSSLVLEDGTGNLTKSGTLMPFGNYDMHALDLFGATRYWLRLIPLLEHTAAEPEEAELPIQEIWMNTVPVSAVEKAPEEYRTLPEGEGFLSCRLTQKNIQQIQVWVNESHLSRKEQEELEKTTKLHRLRNEAGIIDQIWVLWEEAEEIRNLQPDARNYYIERREGILWFFGGTQSLLPENRKERRIKAVYTWGGGRQGNLKEGQVTHLSRSIRFLNPVMNHHRLSGGKDEELPEEAVIRMGHQLLHGNRAVMLSDYEALALEAAREVKRVKAFSNRDGMGERQQGAITLVVLQEAYRQEAFPPLQEIIERYIRSRMPDIRQVQSRFYIVEPWFTEIQVTAVCKISSHASVFACKAEAEARMNQFLDPLTGNFDGKGWNIGQAPTREQIRNVLHRIRGICRLQRMVVKAYCRRNGRLQEMNLEGKLPEFLMIINGSHRFQMELDDNGREGVHA
ncbi:MAG: baseplate J/gp47 family protein [Bacteroides sp.]|nr:baseplate J/gp47 family protein [Bacteroides sp.]MCM1548445.1 baseplate J/gp47 family protein [Clostridium sp.]